MAENSSKRHGIRNSIQTTTEAYKKENGEEPAVEHPNGTAPVTQDAGTIMEQTSTIRYKWEIDAGKLDQDEEVRSPTFTTSSDRLWRLKTKKERRDGVKDEALSIFLCYASPRPIEVAFEFAVVNEKCSALARKSHQAKFDNGDNYHWGFKTFCHLKDLKLKKNGNRIRIICSIVEKASKESSSMETFHADFQRLFETKEDSDMTIYVSGEVIRVHKFILKLRCKLLSTKTTAKADLNVFKTFLRYIYTGEVVGLTEHPEELFKMAVEFQMADLREICEGYLKSDINLDNCCRYLKLAIECNAGGLREKAMEYVTRNFSKVKLNENWTRFIKENHSILKEVVDRIG